MTFGHSMDTAVEQESRSRKRRRWLAVLLIVFLVALYLFWRIVPQPADEYADIQEHFKYGSIGSDNSERGIPYRLWQVLPQMFPEHLPEKGAAGKGYEAFGMIREPGKDRPIGFSKRRVLGLELVGLNCAICHAGVIRMSPESPPQIVLGMPSNTVDLQAFFQFLFDCAEDGRFTVDGVMEAIRANGSLDWYERLVYPRTIRQFREQVLVQKTKLEYWEQTVKFPKFGPGRIDTFNPYKRLFFDMEVGEYSGTSDFPSLWNQRPRRSMQLHWDGNNDKVEERNISAAIGAGVVAPHYGRSVDTTLDERSMARLAEWILDFGPPSFPVSKIDSSKLPHGERVFQQHCALCHALDGASTGKVTPLADAQLGTDPHRLHSFTPEMPQRMNTWGRGYSWKFSHFQKTDGYANSPLDGIWLRGPYLHNGSVPTLRDLLKAPSERPKSFYRGNATVNWIDVGCDSTNERDGMRRYHRFDTSLPGNSNRGHTYGTELPQADKEALLEYLKTL